MRPRLYQKRFRTCFCAGMIMLSVCIRLATDPVSASQLRRKMECAAASPQLLQAVLFLHAGVAMDAPPAATKPVLPEPSAPPSGTSHHLLNQPWDPPADTTAEPVPTEPTEPSEPTVPAVHLEFSAAEADQISFRGNCTYEVDKSELLVKPLSWSTPADGPQVLIMHSHTCESYTPTEGYEYESSGNYRTLDNSRNVVAVGDVITRTLEQRGISVLHDTTYHDYPSYNSSYSNARKTIESYLEQYPSIVMVIDVHRDAADQIFREVTELDGEECAQVMLVIGTDEGGLYHPGWRDNLSCALKLQALMNRAYPGLCKKLAFRAERFNQHETPASMIVEVGSNGNSLPEALAAAVYFGEAVAALLLAQMS